MSNPQWREVHPSRSAGSEPGAGPRYRDSGAPGAGGQAPRGFDPRWHDPRRSGGDPARRGPGGSGRDPQWRAPGNGDPRTGATTRRMPAPPGATRPVPAQPVPTQPVHAQPVPAQAAAPSEGRPRQAAPGTDRRAPGGREDLGGRGRANLTRGPREPRGLSRLGSLPGGAGVCIIIASAAIGAVATVLTRTAPGHVLGACVVAGTVVAALVVRPSAGRLIFPVPVLFYLIAALASGIAYDRSADSSKTALAIGATQWIAEGFFAMALATVLAIVLTTVRWYVWRRVGRAAAAPGRPQAGAEISRWPQDDTEEIAGRGGRPDPRGWNDPGRRPQGPSGFQGPDQRPGWRPDPRTGPPPGAGPYNFSSGA
jgi:hypothetical protein